jgi:hypothetical protein
MLVITGTEYSCDQKLQNDVVQDYNLQGNQWRAFNVIMENWRNNNYQKCLNQFNLQLTCDGCDAIYIKVKIKVDKSGHLVRYVKTGANICTKDSTEELERCFMEYMESLTFPECLRDIGIEITLGTILKC